MRWVGRRTTHPPHSTLCLQVVPRSGLEAILEASRARAAEDPDPDDVFDLLDGGTGSGYDASLNWEVCGDGVAPSGRLWGGSSSRVSARTFAQRASGSLDGTTKSLHVWVSLTPLILTPCDIHRS